MAARIPGIYDDALRSQTTRYVGFTSFSILLWDHIVTLSDEIEYIWYGTKGPLVYLFFLNRYLTPLGFVVNLFAYNSPVWTKDMCSHFIRYEGSMTMIGIEVVALMMLLRVYAMYYQNRVVWCGVAFLLVVQTCVNAWLLTKGQAVVHNPESGVHSCTMIFDPALSVAASTSAWLPLLYDTVVLCLTLWRTLRGRREASAILPVLLRDGLLYYSVIFSVTFVLTIMIISAPDGIKNITAQLELLITVTMMSRITLNLKKQRDHIALGFDTAVARTQDIPNAGIRSFLSLPPLPVSFGQIMSTGWIMNAGPVQRELVERPNVDRPNLDRPNTGTSTLTATSTWKGKEKEIDGEDLLGARNPRPGTGSSNTTAVSAYTSKIDAQSDETHDGLNTNNFYDALGKLENGISTS